MLDMIFIHSITITNNNHAANESTERVRVMRKVIEVKTIYTWETATDEIRDKILDKQWNINIDHEWWDFIYDELSELGLECREFDIDRGSYCKLEFKSSACEIAQNILNNHGESCETWQTANSFMQKWQPVYNEYLDPDSNGYEISDLEDNLMELEDEFLQELQEDYLSILCGEYEYLTSEEAITETIICNEYEFLADGSIY